LSIAKQLPYGEVQETEPPPAKEQLAVQVLGQVGIGQYEVVPPAVQYPRWPLEQL
jgi:hypothetical protein